MLSEHVKKLEPPKPASVIVKWCSHIRKQFGMLQNVKHGGTISSILVLGTYCNEYENKCSSVQ